MEFNKIPRFELGNQIEIAGMVLQGNGHNKVLLFDKANENAKFEIIKLTHHEWKDLMFQLDNLEVEVLDPANPLQKTIVRKSQRQIELGTNWNVFRRDDYTCRYCGKNDVPLTVDHIVLWEHMGATVEDNLISACRKCNKTRGNMMYDDWIESEYYKKNVPQGLIFANITSGEKAKLVPLRVTKRNR